MHPTPSCRSHAGGFTLIEVMIAVAIVGVLATVALPAYFDQVRKSRRSEAIALMSQVAQAEERWRSNQAQFTNVLGSAGLAIRSSLAASATSLNDTFYTINVPTNTATEYRIRAVAAGAQLNDKRCAILEMRVAGGNTLYVSTPQGTAMTDAVVTDTNRCWSR